MNAVSGTDQPARGTVSAGHASRRTLLKGAALAGAAGLAAPLLAPIPASSRPSLALWAAAATATM